MGRVSFWCFSTISHKVAVWFMVPEWSHNDHKDWLHRECLQSSSGGFRDKLVPLVWIFRLQISRAFRIEQDFVSNKLSFRVIRTSERTSKLTKHPIIVQNARHLNAIFSLLPPNIAAIQATPEIFVFLLVSTLPSALCPLLCVDRYFSSSARVACY